MTFFMTVSPSRTTSVGSLTVVPDAGGLRLFDRDHHRRDDRDAGQDVGAKLFLNVLHLAFSPRFELQAPAVERILAQQEFRPHLLQVLDAKAWHRVRQP